MRLNKILLCVVCVTPFLGGCGGGGSSGATVATSTVHGTLIENPPLRVASLNAADLTAQLNASVSGQQLLALSGAPTCGIDYHYLQYWTVGGAGETVTATGVLMVPTAAPGASAAIVAQCSGPRPIVVYAHGTASQKTFNMAAVGDSTNPGYSESALMGAMFAAQGYIVVAPNYAGYDTSSLPYHPYLNAVQQSGEMVDALTAARSALGHIFAAGTTDNGKLFLTGYSQGGHVAMATHRAMQAAGMTVTASAPMSGPYALGAFADAIFFGDVDLGATVFSPFLTTSYQKAYGNIYSATSDIYAPPYAAGIETLLPNVLPVATLFQQNQLPQTAMFNSIAPNGTGNATLDALFPTITPPTTPAAQAPLFALGFAPTNYLVNNSYRAAFVADALLHPDGAVPTVTTGLPAVAPANTLRQAFKTNDLRNWQPVAPVMLCGGHGDPTVFYNVNTLVMQAYWAHLPIPLQVIDVDGGAAPVGALQQGFAQAEGVISAAAGGGVAGQNAVLQAYHAQLVPPFCSLAVRGFFAQF
ncbi:MAG: alpha/beta hydrolase [Ferrovum sp.]|nr:alpha/beta hydrolase [Ferrovum sp.]NDU87324.1 alpha/beta hydrolase [Ferrovum sp.]